MNADDRRRLSSAVGARAARHRRRRHPGLAARDGPLGSTIAFVPSRGPRWVQSWPRRGALGRWIHAFDDTVDRWVEHTSRPQPGSALLRVVERRRPRAALDRARRVACGPPRRSGDRVAVRRRARRGVGPDQRPDQAGVPSHPPAERADRDRFPTGCTGRGQAPSPSGHATSAFTAATLLSEGSPASSAYWELAVLVAASRVYVRMHHASDAVAGTLLGLAFGQIAKRGR